MNGEQKVTPAAEQFELLRQCVRFASATRPYVLTDDQEFELLDWLTELEEAEAERQSAVAGKAAAKAFREALPKSDAERIRSAVQRRRAYEAGEL